MPPSIDPSPGGSPLPEYSRTDVAKHTTDGDRWIILRDKVYDISKFISIHPGTDVPLRGLSGKDATSVYQQYHPVEQWEVEPRPYLIGKVKDAEKRAKWCSELSKDFDQMVRQIKADGLNEINSAHQLWYAKWMMVYVCLLFLSCKLITSDSLWKVTLGSTLMALYWQQIAFIGHDAGHCGITHVRDHDWYWGFFVTSTFGVSGKWWKRNHNTHHIFPNSVDWDPDIQHLPIFSVSPLFLKGVYSQYYESNFHFGRLEKWFVSMQHYLWIPIMGVARYNMYAQSFLLVFKTSKFMEDRFLELSALLVYWTWYVCVLSNVQHTSWMVWSIVLSHFLVGLLHFQIVLSHFPMATYLGNGYDGTKGENWLVRQFETTMDIDCPWYMDWFHGGLQYQCVHHLIPRLPRPNLRYVKNKYVIPFAKRHDLKYHHHDWFTAIGIYAKMMRDQAKNASEIKFKDSHIFDLFMSNG